MMENETSIQPFEEFLKKKQIDPAHFASALPVYYAKWESEFAVLGPKAFDHARKFQFNPIRLQFPLKTTLA